MPMAARGTGRQQSYSADHVAIVEDRLYNLRGDRVARTIRGPMFQAVKASLSLPIFVHLSILKTSASSPHIAESR